MIKNTFFKNVFSVAVFLCIQNGSHAQAGNELQDAKYRRSSLHTILIESEDFPKKDQVINAYSSAPFPEKYDNHNIGIKSFDPKKYALSKEEISVTGKKSSKIGGLGRSMVSEASGGLVDSTAKDMPLIIAKFLKEQKIANKMVANGTTAKVTAPLMTN